VVNPARLKPRQQGHRGKACIDARHGDLAETGLRPGDHVEERD
jgi:hypothetical protein